MKKTNIAAMLMVVGGLSVVAAPAAADVPCGPSNFGGSSSYENRVSSEERAAKREARKQAKAERKAAKAAAKAQANNPCAANPCAANPCAANPCAANPCAANPCAAAPQ